MAANYNKPISTDNYLDILTQLRDNIAAAQNMLDDLTGVANIPTGALRYDQTAKKFQIYNGTTFVDSVLSAAGGGTGINNWVKATTGEAEAGAANKYPDAAGVLSAIAASTGTAATYNVGTGIGEIPTNENLGDAALSDFGTGSSDVMRGNSISSGNFDSSLAISAGSGVSLPSPPTSKETSYTNLAGGFCLTEIFIDYTNNVGSENGTVTLTGNPNAPARETYTICYVQDSSGLNSVPTTISQTTGDVEFNIGVSGSFTIWLSALYVI